MKKKTFALALASLLLLPLCAACENAGDAEEQGSQIPSNAVEILLNGDSVTCEDSSVYIADDKLTITSFGTYAISGEWNNGQICVECADAGEVNLILNNATITNQNQACIFIKKAQSATITLQDGSVNTLTDGALYTFDNPTDDEPDAALFSKEDLILTGTGTLIVEGNYMNGIVGKDGLTIESGVYEVSSVEHGIKGKDYLVVNGGEITVDAEGDGLKSTNSKEAQLGYVEINGGVVNVHSDDEAIQAVTKITVNGGELNVDSTNNGLRSDDALIFNGGVVSIDAEDDALDAPSITVADGASVTVNGVPYQG